MAGSFVQRNFGKLLVFYQVSQNEMLNKIGIGTNESYQVRLSDSSCLKELCENSNNWYLP